MTTDVNKIREQLSQVLSIIDPAFVDAILELHRRLSKENISWAVGGDLAEALRTVQVKPECIEIWTDMKGAEEIFASFRDLASKGITFETKQLEQKAVIEQKEYPVYTRSYYFEFTVKGVQVQVHGDLQFKVGAWDWGDKLEFTPEYVFIVGAKTAIVPLQVKYEMYNALGWTERAERIRQVMIRHFELAR